MYHDVTDAEFSRIVKGYVQRVTLEQHEDVLPDDAWREAIKATREVFEEIISELEKPHAKS